MQFLNLLPHWCGCKIHYHLKLRILQKKPLRLMFFQNRNAHTGPFFENSKILTFFDKVAHENCLLISSSLHKALLKILCDWFTVSFESHTHNI